MEVGGNRVRNQMKCYFGTFRGISIGATASDGMDGSQLDCEIHEILPGG
jgi:hypothetical protein